MLELSAINKYYGEGAKKFHALKDISLSVAEGEFIAILGPSGSGKSTLLNIIGGLDIPDSGTISLNGKPYSNENDKEMAAFRNRTVGFVFQSFNLVNVLSVYENIVLPVLISGNTPDRSYIESLITELKLDEQKNKLPNKLSGGQQQRVAIARALANKPPVILADEPTGNLDTETGNIVMDIFMKLVKGNGTTLIMITHNPEIAKLADRTITINNGMIV